MSPSPAPTPSTPLDVLVPGGTGHLGRPLCAALVARGHRVRVLCRPESLDRVVPGAEAALGLEWQPWTREAAHRLGFVSSQQMVAALVAAVEHPPVPAGRRIIEVPAIRGATLPG